MTTHARGTTRPDARTTSPPATTLDEGAGRVRRAAVAAGGALLLMSAVAFFANFMVLEALVTEGDAARTADDIAASTGMFRLGIAGWVLIVILDVVVAWAMYEVFAPVDRGLSVLAAWARLAYAAVLLVAVSHLVGVPRLLPGADDPTALAGDRQVLAQLDAFQDTWDLGLILFGGHLVLLGYLAYRSGYVPRILGALVTIAGLGYVFDGFTIVLMESPPVTVGAVTFIGEFLLAVWLVVRGGRISADRPVRR